MMKADNIVRSTCPYCGVGCQVLLNVKDDRIFRIDAPFEAAPNYGRLCVKGHFGADYVHHPDRLTVPLIRKEPQKPGQRTPAKFPDDWREVSWDEALDYAAGGLARIHQPAFGRCIRRHRVLYHVLYPAGRQKNYSDL